MLDPRHPDDTLFLYLEADMRWYKEDCMAKEMWLPMTVTTEEQEASAQDDKPAAPRPGEPSSSAAGASRPAADKTKSRSKEPPPRVPGKFKDLEQSIRVEGPERECTEELLEIVQLCNVASRKGYGEVVWLGYNCAGEGYEKGAPGNIVGFGSQLMAFTKAAARAFLSRMSTDMPMHIDIYFKWYLEEAVKEPLAHDEVFSKCCHVVPPLGNFLEHVSGCTSGVERPGFWHHDWCVAGTLSEHPRYLRRFFRKTRAAGAKICDLEFPADTSLHWKTRKPPMSHCYTNRTLYSILRSMRYLDDDDWYVGPQWMPYEQKEWEKRREKKRKGEPLASLRKSWHQLMREVPDEIEDAENMSAPMKAHSLTRLQRHVCCHPVGQSVDARKFSDRRYRRWKQWVKLHCQRFFVDYEEQEAVSICISLSHQCHMSMIVWSLHSHTDFGSVAFETF